MSTSPQHVGKYVLHECLRRNGKIEVWKALDTESKHLVAIKLLHSDLQVNLDFLAHFEREARTLASLHHPNIVHVCDFHISRSPASGSSLAYIVMDYIEGQTLADYIRNTSRMRKFPSASDIVHLFASLSIAIDYAHQYGVIHHNIKPGNILLDQRHSTPNALGEPILTGFSIGSWEHTTTSAATNAQIDTALYLAPEQARGYVGNELSDIYSLGVILYEICTGVPPFQGDTPTAIKMQHINTMPRSPVLMNPNISPTLTDVILRSLTKDPALRFSSASSMSRALAEAFDVPVPENLFLSSPITDHMNEPTYYKSLLTNMLPGGKQSFPSIEIIKSSSPPPTGLSTLSQQQTAIVANRGQSIPITSASGLPDVPFANLSPNIPVTSSSAPPGPTPPTRCATRF